MASFQVFERLLQLVIGVDGLSEFLCVVIVLWNHHLILILLSQVLYIMLYLLILFLVYWPCTHLLYEVLLLHLLHFQSVAHNLAAFKCMIGIEVILSSLYAVFFLVLGLGLVCGCVSPTLA